MGPEGFSTLWQLHHHRDVISKSWIFKLLVLEKFSHRMAFTGNSNQKNVSCWTFLDVNLRKKRNSALPLCFSTLLDQSLFPLNAPVRFVQDLICMKISVLFPPLNLLSSAPFSKLSVASVGEKANKVLRHKEVVFPDYWYVVSQIYGKIPMAHYLFGNKSTSLLFVALFLNIDFLSHDNVGFSLKCTKR